MSKLSTRGQFNVDQIIAKIPRAILEPTSDPNKVNLSMAENHLIRGEVSQFIKSAISKSLKDEHLDWPKGFWGDSQLLELFSKLFNGHFQPYFNVEPKHLAVTAGAAACLDSILYTLCDDGDAVLVPTPYWSGYDAFFTGHSGVVPLGVDVVDFEDSLGTALIDVLEEALKTSQRRVRGLVLSNPHNPLGRCYSAETLKRCIQFCQKHDIHLVSDEVFALSEFDSPDLPDAPNFTSILSLDPLLLDADPSRIHLIWSLSKDFAASGVRLGCVLTQNKHVADSIALVSSVHVSALSTLFAKELLGSPTLPALVQNNKQKLKDAYVETTTFLKRVGITYFPCNAAVAVFCRLAPNATTVAEEMAAFHQYLAAGVMVAPGIAYHVNASQKGWMRISFAVNQEDLQKGLARIESVYRSLQ